MNGVIMLTLDGLTRKKMIKEIELAVDTDVSNKKAAIITTASKGKEENPYSKKAKYQYMQMQFGKVVFADLEDNPDFDFSDYDLIHVCGGNTFKLLHFARLANLKKSIEYLLEKNGIYVGVSAGSLIMPPSIDIVRECSLDSNLIKMTDFTAFAILPIYICVHYEPKDEKWGIRQDNYIKNNNRIFYKINNDQAIL